MPKTVLTFGVFDIFHIGHLRLFKRASKFGQSLIVAVQEDSAVTKYKPQARLQNNLTDRMELLREIKCVDKVIPYQDVDKDIQKIEFDILIIGEDQNHAGFEKAVNWCKMNNKEVIKLQRTKGISSTILRDLV